MNLKDEIYENCIKLHIDHIFGPDENLNDFLIEFG